MGLDEGELLVQARQLFFAGIDAFEKGELPRARSLFEDSLLHAPGRISVMLNLGLTLFKMGEFSAATSYLEKVVVSEPEDVNGWGALGLSQEALGQWSSAVQSLHTALRIAPHDAGLWLACGRCELRLNSVDLALRAFDEAVKLAPDAWGAWSERGSLLRELGRLEDAAECFEMALARGGDVELHSYYLASVKQGPLPLSPPRSYVSALFDQYADDFESHLVSDLRYTAHESLVKPILQSGRRYGLVGDLGCGTGLCGKLLSPVADEIVGVDISEQMAERARACGAYSRVEYADLQSFLNTIDRSADLIIAADVFIYVGELSSVFSKVRRVLTSGGCFAFTVELARDIDGFRLLPSLRFAHSRGYIVRLAGEHGYRVSAEFEAPLRYDQMRPVQGLYFYLSVAE